MSQPPNAPVNFPQWAKLLKLPPSQEEALAAFKVMAEKDSGSFTDRPSRGALNPRRPKAMQLRVYMNLAEPDGVQDHCLFKDDEDEKGRKYKGQRRPEDYKPERAERIEFLPEVLLEPDWVFEEKSKPNNWIYACQTGPDQYYLVVVDVREKKGGIDCDLITAYPVNEKGWRSKLKRYRKIYSK